jgi:hypothetical protein
MKKTILFLVMAVALTSQALFAQVPSYVPTNGLVVYYPFTGNANEQFVNSNNGIINGATLTTDRNGNANSAYNFNGTNSYIDLQQNFYGGQSTSTVTFVLRFKVEENGDYFIWNKDGSWLEAGIYTRTNGKFGIFWAYPNQYNGIETSIGKILPNIWYDAVIIINGLNSKIYLNNIEQTGLTINIPSNIIGFGDAGTCGVGINRFGFKKTSCFPDEYFKGVLDEFYLYDRILTQQEITNIYNSSLPQTACLPANVPTSGLVGYWPFCGNANDESGNGNNGNVGTGINITSDRFGNSNSAYSFLGTGNISLTNLPTSGNTDFTISGWIKTNNQTLRKGIMCWGQDTPWASTYFFVNSTGRLQFDFAYNGGASSLSIVNDNNWHQVTVTCINGLIQLYIDGLQNGSAVQMSPNISGNNKSIGSNIDNSGQNNFIGLIDDIGIWNRALTQEEITNLYNANQCITNITVTDTLVINVGQLSFNDPVTWANNITIAPNPASSQININFNNITNLNGGTLKIINSLGQEVATTPITTSGTNSTMQLATWGGTGMYFVQIINPQGQIVDIKKIILQ